MSSLQAPSSTVSHSFLLVAAQAWANKQMLSLLMSPALHQAPLSAENCFPACPRWAREGIQPGEGGPHPAVEFCASGGLVKEHQLGRYAATASPGLGWWMWTAKDGQNVNHSAWSFLGAREWIAEGPALDGSSGR